MLQIRRLYPWAFVLALFCAGCASSSSAPEPDGTSRRVTLHDYGLDTHFELVGESHTNRVDYYSTKRGDAARKVQTDEIMKALVDKLEEEGFERFSQPGKAPAQGGQLITRAIEIRVQDDLSHWTIGKGSMVEERLAFNACMKPFLDLYNLSQSFQAVHNTKGRDYFEGAPNKQDTPRR